MSWNKAAAVRIQSIQRGRVARKQRASQMQRNDSIRKRNERVNETANYKALLHELERLKEEANARERLLQNSEHAPRKEDKTHVADEEIYRRSR